MFVVVVVPSIVVVVDEMVVVVDVGGSPLALVVKY
jgi:hypothetical protein